jgi:hypothetical protein
MLTAMGGSVSSHPSVDRYEFMFMLCNCLPALISEVVQVTAASPSRQGARYPNKEGQKDWSSATSVQMLQRSQRTLNAASLKRSSAPPRIGSCCRFGRLHTRFIFAVPSLTNVRNCLCNRPRVAAPSRVAWASSKSNTPSEPQPIRPDVKVQHCADPMAACAMDRNSKAGQNLTMSPGPDLAAYTCRLQQPQQLQARQMISLLQQPQRQL